MAQTAKVLTSLHGKEVGLDVNRDLIVKGRKVPSMDDYGALKQIQLTPATCNATASMLATDILGGIVTSTSAAVVAASLPTGTLLDAAAGLQVSESFEWAFINTGPSVVTITAAATHTIVGAAAIASGISNTFLTRKTAANTFVTYNIAS